MTPDKRLNQIEPVLADVAQKVDRLIEGNGQIINEVSKIPGIERTVSITAKGLADLTGNVTKRFDQQQDQISDLRQEMNQGFDEVKQQFAEVNQRFDQLITLIQERLK